jgi:hypothetical protein
VSVRACVRHPHVTLRARWVTLTLACCTMLEQSRCNVEQTNAINECEFERWRMTKAAEAEARRVLDERRRFSARPPRCALPPSPWERSEGNTGVRRPGPQVSETRRPCARRERAWGLGQDASPNPIRFTVQSMDVETWSLLARSPCRHRLPWPSRRELTTVRWLWRAECPRGRSASPACIGCSRRWGGSRK